MLSAISHSYTPLYDFLIKLYLPRPLFFLKEKEPVVIPCEPSFLSKTGAFQVCYFAKESPPELSCQVQEPGGLNVEVEDLVGSFFFVVVVFFLFLKNIETVP